MARKHVLAVLGVALVLGARGVRGRRGVEDDQVRRRTTPTTRI